MAPIGVIFPVRADTTHLVPIPSDTGRTLNIRPQELNIDFWIADGVERAALDVTMPYEKDISLFDDDHPCVEDHHFIVYYTPQRAPFTPCNRVIRLLSLNTLDSWFGNIVVIKTDASGYVFDMKERDLALVEHIVPRYVSNLLYLLN